MVESGVQMFMCSRSLLTKIWPKRIDSMIRFPEVTERGDQKDYAYEKDREAAGKKIKSVLSILESKGTEIVILGAWGCGAYGNPVGEIARIWRRALLGEGRKRSRNNDHAGGYLGSDKAT